MTVNNKVLAALHKNEAQAMGASEIYGICKWAEDLKQISTALSQLYSSGKISRKEVNQGHTKYVYWNQPRGKMSYELSELGSVAKAEATKEKSFLSRQVDEYRPAYGCKEKKPTQEITAQVAEGAPKPLPAAIPTVCLGSMVDNLIEAIDSANETSEAVADIKTAAEAALKNSALDIQVGGDHYKKLGMYQPWQVLDKWLTPAELKGFAKGTVIAYLAREEDKGGHTDIEKAAHTLQIYLDLVKAKSTPTHHKGETQ